MTDFDGDGRPDSCDAACHALGMSLDLDIDGDGVPDLLDIAEGPRLLLRASCGSHSEAAPSSSSDLVFSRFRMLLA